MSNETPLTADPRAARDDLLRALQENGVTGRRRQRIEDAADWFARESVRAARQPTVDDHPVAGFVRAAVASEPTLSWPGEIDDIIEDAEQYEAGLRQSTVDVEALRKAAQAVVAEWDGAGQWGLAHTIRALRAALAESQP